MKLNIPAPKMKVCSVGNVLRNLGKIDTLVESGKLSKKQHDIRSRKVLAGCLK